MGSRTDKPPYLVPTMESMAGSPRNGLTVASTFSGAGGSCTGYEMAGFTVAWANEFEPNAAQSYALNHPGTHLDVRSIRDVTGADVLAATGLDSIDLLDGSPPCQSFSMAGKRQKGWGEHHDHSDGTSQRSDDLFFEYSRLLGELRPRAFVAENVAGLVAGTAKGMFKRVMAALSEQGYVVRARLLDAQWLGVPQSRRRVIILGMRDDLGIEPEFPLPLQYRYSILDACPWIADGGDPSVVSDTRSVTKDAKGKLRYPPTSRAADEPASTITASSHSHTTVQFRQGGWKGFDAADLGEPSPTIQASQNQTRVAPFSERPTLSAKNGSGFKRVNRSLDEPSPTIVANEQRGDGFRIEGGARRARLQMHNETGWGEQVAELDGPSPTILSAQGTKGSNAHPQLMEEAGKRSLTIGEVKRLCSFPDDYVLIGGYSQQWARLGNSVPPVMMSHVAAALRDQLLALDRPG